MKERIVHQQRSFVSDHKSSKVAEPCESSFDDPSSAIPAKTAPVLGFRLHAVDLMRRDKLNSTFFKARSQRVAVCPFVVDQPVGFSARRPTIRPGHRNLIQCCFNEREFRGGRRAKVVSQRNTFAVDHHHPLRALSPAGFADCVAPFFAEAKLPSMKHSLHFNWPRSSSWERYARQIFSQIPSSSQSFNRRQQVDGLGNSSGKSFQCAPVRRIHNMPSKTRRLSAQGRPPFFDLGSSGRKGAILSHISSLKIFSRTAIGLYLRPFYVISKILHV